MKATVKSTIKRDRCLNFTSCTYKTLQFFHHDLSPKSTIFSTSPAKSNQLICQRQKNIYVFSHKPIFLRTHLPPTPTPTMHFPTTLLILALSAGAPALPTNTTAPLEARVSGMGSIAAFAAPDCSGPPTGPRPEDGNSNCIAFSGATNNIGVNWGSSFLYGRAAGLYVFTDGHCKDYASKMIPAGTYDDAKGTNACISMKDNGGPWGSVMFSHF